MLDLIKLLVIAGFLLVTVFLVLIAWPKSKLIDRLGPVAYGIFAMLCGIYIISPVDAIPEALLGPLGLIDDAGALVAGVAAIVAAIKSRKRPLET